MNEILQKRIEEAAEAIVEDYNHYQFLNDGTKDVYTQAAVLFMLNEMAQFILSNQWISVEEAPPEDDEQVIAMSEFGDIERMKYHNKAFYHLKGSIIKDGEKITHWMSIPELKGGEK